MVLGVFPAHGSTFCGVRRLCSNRIKPRSRFYMWEGFYTTALAGCSSVQWGAVPFVLTGSILNPVDAMFETCFRSPPPGASIPSGREDLPRGILFWRSFTTWTRWLGRSGVPALPCYP